MISLATAALIGGLLSAGGSIANTAIQNAYNRREAQKQRDFEKEMSNTAIQRQMADAQSAGISPALIMGGASTPSGYAAQSSGNENPMRQAASALFEYIKEDRQLDAMERMQNARIEAQKTMSNTAKSKSGIKRQYTKKELNNMWTDLDNVKL